MTSGIPPPPHPPAATDGTWKRKLPGRLLQALTYHDIKTFDQALAFAGLEDKVILRKSLFGQTTLGMLRTWAAEHGVSAPLPLVDTNAGIKKTVSFTAPDGTIHTTYRDAQQYLIRQGFKAWFKDHVSLFEFEDDRAADKILDEWLVNRRKKRS